MHWIRRGSWHLEGTESGPRVTGDKDMKSSPILKVHIGMLNFKYGHRVVKGQLRSVKTLSDGIRSGRNFPKFANFRPQFPHWAISFSNHSKLMVLSRNNGHC